LIEKVIVLLSFLGVLGCGSPSPQGDLPLGGAMDPNIFSFVAPKYHGCKDIFYSEYDFYMTLPEMPPEVAREIAGYHFLLCYGQET